MWSRVAGPRGGVRAVPPVSRRRVGAADCRPAGRRACPGAGRSAGLCCLGRGLVFLGQLPQTAAGIRGQEVGAARPVSPRGPCEVSPSGWWTLFRGLGEGLVKRLVTPEPWFSCPAPPARAAGSGVVFKGQSHSLLSDPLFGQPACSLFELSRECCCGSLVNAC